MMKVLQHTSVQHGGDLDCATSLFGRPEQGWLDLSTGISPWPYPVPAIPDTIFHHLPYNHHHLLLAAEQYYACPYEFILPTNGSQDVIVRIPYLLPKAKVALPKIGYQEHCRWWSKAGHTPYFYCSYKMLEQYVADNPDSHIVIINPNNPLAKTWTIDRLLSLQKNLNDNAYMIVDEAFMDLAPDSSLATHISSERHNLIVLRSLGKFFGLAGLRLGFVLGNNPLLKALREQLQPWSVNHPALWLGEKVLLDSAWQTEQRQTISRQSQQLHTALAAWCSFELHSAGLFSTVFGPTSRLQPFYVHAAKQGVLFRYAELPKGQSWLRCGLPGEHWQRLQQLLQTSTTRLNHDLDNAVL
ncbi:MAG: threonine-phosphate decarboxylase [Pseudomonadota bacterium]